jgi:hypothetical protein
VTLAIENVVGAHVYEPGADPLRNDGQVSDSNRVDLKRLFDIYFTGFHLVESGCVHDDAWM